MLLMISVLASWDVCGVWCPRRGPGQKAEPCHGQGHWLRGQAWLQTLALSCTRWVTSRGAALGGSGVFGEGL